LLLTRPSILTIGSARVDWLQDTLLSVSLSKCPLQKRPLKRSAAWRLFCLREHPPNQLRLWVPSAQRNDLGRICLRCNWAHIPPQGENRRRVVTQS